MKHHIGIILFSSFVFSNVSFGQAFIDDSSTGIQSDLISNMIKTVSGNFSDPTSIQFRNIHSPDQTTICGEVHAKNKMGGYVDFMPFLYDQTANDWALIKSPGNYGDASNISAPMGKLISARIVHECP